MRMTLCVGSALLVAATTASQVVAVDFQTRCQSPDVVKCVGFDSQPDITGTWGDNHGSFGGTNSPVLDTTVKASGAASLKFIFPSQSGAGAAGQYFTNFSDPASAVQFGANSDFFVQWRQRFSPEFLSTAFLPRDTGFKDAIIGAGDMSTCGGTSVDSANCTTSCSDLEMVTVNDYQRGFPIVYNSCNRYIGLYSVRNNETMGHCDGATTETFCRDNSECAPAHPNCVGKGAQQDIYLQNARAIPYCTRGESLTYPATTFFPPKGNCFKYFPNEWMTFQMEIKPGPRVKQCDGTNTDCTTKADCNPGNPTGDTLCKDDFANSYVRMWVARDGQPSELVVNWGPGKIDAGPATRRCNNGVDLACTSNADCRAVNVNSYCALGDQKFGKVWLLPYMTNKDATQVTPIVYTWYDELIISRSRIPDPAASGGTQPQPPANLHVK